MKPRFRRFVSNALPTLIIVPAFSAVAPAAVLNVSSLGSIEIPSGYNQADSIRANGSSSPSPQLTVTIAQTATLTGDSDFQDGIRVSVADYTINNFGSLSTSLRDGIRFTANGGIVNNSGSIVGSANGISAGTGLNLTNEVDAIIRGKNGDGIDIDEVQKTINSGMSIITSELEDISVVQTSIDNYGSIIGEGGAGIDGSSMVETVKNWGTIEGNETAINLKGGDDSIVLYNGSLISGDIYGGSGTDTLTFTNGARFFHDNDRNVVRGSVFEMETIIKNGFGTAMIGEGSFAYDDGPGQQLMPEFFPYSSRIVQANEIKITGGALYINGHVAPSDAPTRSFRDMVDPAPRTSILADGGEIGGTNGSPFLGWPEDPFVQNITLDGPQGWQADITLRNGGGISAGSEPQDLSPAFGGLPAGLAKETEFTPTSIHPSIGVLRIEGNITHETPKTIGKDSIDSPEKSAPTYIRVDITPDAPYFENESVADRLGSDPDIAPIIDQRFYDRIIQTGRDSIYDMAGAEVWIAPTNQNAALTNGLYTIIDSQRNIVGFDPETTRIGVVVKNESAPIFEGMASKSEVMAPTSYVSYDTVLGNFFATLHLANPVNDEESGSVNLLRGVDAFELLPIYSGTDLILEIDYNFSDLPGLSENESAFGEALDQFIDEPGDYEDDALSDLLQDIVNEDLPTVQAALATLDPSSSFGIAQSVINSNLRLNRLTQNHLAAVRGSARTHRKVGTYSDDANCSMPSPVTSTVTGRGNVWGTISYDNQDFEGDTNQADFEGDTGTFTAGVDWLVGPQLMLGLVFDGSRSDLDGQNANSTDVDSFRAAAYGTWGGATGLYSDFMVGVGDHDLENTRSFAFLGNLSSDTDATSVQALWTFGYTMGNDQVKHGPFAGFEYQRLDVDGYTQEGIVPIAVSDYDIDSLRAILGYRVDAAYGNFNPYAAVAYSHEFQNGSNKANATVGGQPFTVVGAEQSSAFLVSIGTGYTLTDALTLDFGYRGEMATDDGITSHGASLGLNYAF
jgi:uncharacterized protein YhjY with autotransporter beta-barrel domain